MTRHQDEDLAQRVIAKGLNRPEMMTTKKCLSIDSTKPVRLPRVKTMLPLQKNTV